MKIERKDIAQITLLELQDYMDNKELVPLLADWWWLRTHGTYSAHVAYVFIDGDAYPAGYKCDNDKAFVRPAFEVYPNVVLPLPGEKVEVGKFTATVLKNNLLLLDECICQHRFDLKSGTWERAEIKTYMESEEFAELLFGGAN